MRFLFNGVPGSAGVDGWERVSLVSRHQLQVHPTPAPEGTRSPRVVVSNEDQYINSLSVNQVIGCQGGLGLQKQTEMLVPLRARYPDALISVYGLPYCTSTWKSTTGRMEVAYRVWNGTAGNNKDKEFMQRSLKFMVDLLLGTAPTTTALAPVRFNAWSPTIAATEPVDNHAAEHAMLLISMANWCVSYALEAHNHPMSVIPFVHSRRRTGLLRFLTDLGFEQTQIEPVRYGDVDAVVYWQDDDHRIAHAKKPIDPYYSRSMDVIRNDVPAELLTEPIDWSVVAEWYKNQHMRYMKLLVGNLCAPLPTT